MTGTWGVGRSEERGSVENWWCAHCPPRRRPHLGHLWVLWRQSLSVDPQRRGPRREKKASSRIPSEFPPSLPCLRPPSSCLRPPFFLTMTFYHPLSAQLPLPTFLFVHSSTFPGLPMFSGLSRELFSTFTRSFCVQSARLATRLRHSSAHRVPIAIASFSCPSRELP